MCGRYVIEDPSLIPFHWQAEEELDLKEQFNISPGRQEPIIVRNSPNKAVMAKWGLVPSWAKDEKVGYKMINARAEGIESKPSFRHAIKSQRCLVPATGYYEWMRAGDKKYPYYFTVKGQDIFAFAGLYELWHDDKGDQLRTYTIITCEPNKLAEEVHNRMPVILDKAGEDEWLNPAITDPKKVLHLLKPFPASKMDKWRVSTLVNSPANDTAALLKPVED